MSKKKIALIVVLVLLVVIVVAALVVNQKYGVLFASPKVSYDTLVRPETRAQIVFDVPKAESLIKRKLPPNVSVPEWVLPRVLPYQTALVANMDTVLNQVSLALFINDQRLAPVMLEQINSAKLPAPFDQWFKEKMELKERGQMIRKGVAPMDLAFAATLKEIFKGKSGAAEPLKIEGGHLLEAVFDNRDGSATAIIGTFVAALGVPVMDNKGYFGVFTPLDTARVTADLTDPKTLQIHFALECAPDSDANEVGFLMMGLNMGLPELQGSLSKKGIELTGKTVLDKNVIKGDYTIPNFDAVIDKL